MAWMRTNKRLLVVSALVAASLTWSVWLVVGYPDTRQAARRVVDHPVLMVIALALAALSCLWAFWPGQRVRDDQ